MAHEIDMSNNKANMAFTGQLPWHALGQRLTDDASLDQWRVEAGLDWKAKKADVHYKINCAVHSMPERQVIYREDTGTPLGIVSPKYKIVQPGEVLEFFRALTEKNGFKMETAGSLFGGRKIWAQARVGESVKIHGIDEVKPYLLLATSLDGTLATSAHFTSVRVVCNNTLRMSIGSEGQLAQVKVPHLTDFNPDKVKIDLGFADEAWYNFIQNIEMLSNFQIDRDIAIDIVAEELKLCKPVDGQELEPEGKLEASKQLRKIIDLFDGQAIGSNLETARGTGWGLVNAVTQYFDHEVSGWGGDNSRGFDRAQFGDRSKLKTAVADRVLALAA